MIKNIWNQGLKYLLQLFVFLLPFHAVVITFLQCRVGLPTDILRFWKEFIIIFLMWVIKIQLFVKYKGRWGQLLKNNYLVGMIILFIISSLIYTFFPYMTIKTHALLGFKYDVFFLLTLLIWLYLSTVRENFTTLLKTLFASTALVIILFLPWYMSGDIGKKAEVLWYSNKVSTYQAGECLAFAQNVTGWHNRLQASFGDPIRFSVFLSIVYLLFLGYFLQNSKNISPSKKYTVLGIVTLLTFTSIFYAFTKTSILGLTFWLLLFWYLTRKIIHQKELGKKFLIFAGSSFAVILSFLLYIKRDLFLHPEAILGRVENLIQSIQMFFWNPIGYGLWVAGPASQLATSPDKWLSDGVQKFLPENWYVQILLEQWIIGVSIFLSVMIIIGLHLYKIMLRKKDYFSISMFVAYIALCFMANFTHVFEEAATNFILFLLIGWYIVKEAKWFKY